MRKFFFIPVTLFFLFILTAGSARAKYDGNRQSIGFSGNVGAGSFFTCDDCNNQMTTDVTYGGDIHYAYRFTRLYALRFMGGIEKTPYDHLSTIPFFPSLDLTNLFYLGSTSKILEPYLGIGVGTKGLHGNVGIKAAINRNMSLFAEVSGGSYLFRTSGQFTTGLSFEF